MELDVKSSATQPMARAPAAQYRARPAGIPWLVRSRLLSVVAPFRPRAARETGGAPEQVLHEVARLPSGKWRIRLDVDGETRSFGSYATAEEAARRRDILILKLFGKASTGTTRQLSFDATDYSAKDIDSVPGLERHRYLWSSGRRLAAIDGPLTKPIMYGVHQQGTNGYLEVLELDGTSYKLGDFGTVEEAAAEVDLAAIKVWGDMAVLNYPQSLKTYKTQAARKFTSSQYRGVTYSKQKKRWLARLNKSHVRLYTKVCKSEDKAAHAYDQAVKEHLPKEEWANKLNFPEEAGL